MYIWMLIFNQGSSIKVSFSKFSWRHWSWGFFHTVEVGYPSSSPKAQSEILLLVMGKFINNDDNIKLTFIECLPCASHSSKHIDSFKWWFFVLHFRRSLRRWWADREATRLGRQVASSSSKVQTEEKSSEYKKIGKILPLISNLISFKATPFST